MTMYRKAVSIANIREAYECRRLLLGGWRPDEKILAEAPFLDRWSVAIHPHQGKPCFTGQVVDHPRLGTGEITTGPFVSVFYDKQAAAGWARVWSRWYRLGVNESRYDFDGLVPGFDHERTDVEAIECDYDYPPKPFLPRDREIAGPEWEGLASFFGKYYGGFKARQAMRVHIAYANCMTYDEAWIEEEAFHGGYKPPPKELEPKEFSQYGPEIMALADWFDDETRGGWQSSLLVYLAKRFNWSIPEAYHATDGLSKRRDPLYVNYN